MISKIKKNPYAFLLLIIFQFAIFESNSNERNFIINKIDLVSRFFENTNKHGQYLKYRKSNNSENSSFVWASGFFYNSILGFQLDTTSNIIGGHFIPYIGDTLIILDNSNNIISLSVNEIELCNNDSSNCDLGQYIIKSKIENKDYNFGENCMIFKYKKGEKIERYDLKTFENRYKNLFIKNNDFEFNFTKNVCKVKKNHYSGDYNTTIIDIIHYCNSLYIFIEGEDTNGYLQRHILKYQDNELRLIFTVPTI